MPCFSNSSHKHQFAVKSSSIALILVNLYPLIGFIFLDWNLANVLFLYWGENLVIGFYNVFRMLVVEDAKATIQDRVQAILFFLTHFGFFTFIHGIFVFFLTQTNLGVEKSVRVDPQIFLTFYFFLKSNLIPLIGLFFSHGYSFVAIFLLGKERRQANIDRLFFRPYRRILIMHFTILLGAALANLSGQSDIIAILLILIKTFVDLYAHQLEHSFKNRHQGFDLTFVQGKDHSLKFSSQTQIIYQIFRLIQTLAMLAIIGVMIFYVINQIKYESSLNVNSSIPIIEEP